MTGTHITILQANTCLHTLRNLAELRPRDILVQKLHISVIQARQCMNIPFEPGKEMDS